MLDALNGLKRCRFVMRPIQLARHGRIQRVVHQRGFAGAGDAGDAGQQADREIGTHVFQVMAAGANDADRLQVALGCQMRGMAFGPGQGGLVRCALGDVFFLGGGDLYRR